MSNRLDHLPSEARFHHLIANTLCLDFANTLYGHAGIPLHEYLHSYADLVIWSVHAGILDEEVGERLVRRAERQPQQALSVFRRALALRETLYRVFSSLALGRPAQAADLHSLNRARSDALAHSRVIHSSNSYSSGWDDPYALDRMLWPIAISAGELLVSPSVLRVHQCSGKTCDWLFVDTSRNHMRRWCQMSVCGNRAKVQRFQHRSRASSPP